MLTAAQLAIRGISAWIDASSAPRRSPLGWQTPVGRYAVIVPSAMNGLPMAGWDASALPLFVPGEQCDGLTLPLPTMDAPASQDHMWARLAHILFRIEDGTLPPAVVIGLANAGSTIGEALAAVGMAGTDLDAVACLAVPVWAIPEPHHPAIARRLPHVP